MAEIKDPSSADQRRETVEYGLLLYVIKSASTSLMNINIHVRIQGHRPHGGVLTEERGDVLLKVTGNSILAGFCFFGRKQTIKTKVLEIQRYTKRRNKRTQS